MKGMKVWPVQDAKAHFSEMLATCLKEGPQMVTKRGEKAAVLVSLKEWERVQRKKTFNLKDWLMTDFARGDLDIPERGHVRRRPPVRFD